MRRQRLPENERVQIPVEKQPMLRECINEYKTSNRSELYARAALYASRCEMSDAERSVAYEELHRLSESASQAKSVVVHMLLSTLGESRPKYTRRDQNGRYDWQGGIA